jgi:hypothetical protein
MWKQSDRYRDIYLVFVQKGVEYLFKLYLLVLRIHRRYDDVIEMRLPLLMVHPL